MSSTQCAAISKRTGERCKIKTHKTHPCCWRHTLSAERGAKSACAGLPLQKAAKMPVSLRVKPQFFMVDGKKVDAGLGLYVKVNKAFKSRGKVRKSDGARLVFKKGEAIVAYTGEFKTIEKLDEKYLKDSTVVYGVSLKNIVFNKDGEIQLRKKHQRITDENQVIVDASNPLKSSVARYANDCCYKQNKTECNRCTTAKGVEDEKGNIFLIAVKNIYEGDSIMWHYGSEYWKGIQQ